MEALFSGGEYLGPFLRGIRSNFRLESVHDDRQLSDGSEEEREKRR